MPAGRRSGGGRTARAAVTGAAIAIGLGLVLAGCSSNPTNALAKLAHLDAGTLLVSGDVPPDVPGVDSDLLTTSLRLLTEHEGLEFWVGVTRDNQVCFIAEPAGAGAAVAGADAAASSTAPDTLSTASTDSVTGSSEGTLATCLDAQRFGLHGAYLELPSGERAWLHTEYMTVSPGWTEISANIALRG